MRAMDISDRFMVSCSMLLYVVCCSKLGNPQLNVALEQKGPHGGLCPHARLGARPGLMETF